MSGAVAGIARLAGIIAGRLGRRSAPMRDLLRDRRGISALEFGLAAPVIFTAIFGMFETGRLYWTNNTMQYAAEEAARYGMVHTSASDAQITDMAKSVVAGVSTAPMVVTISSDTISGITYLTVTTTYPFDFDVPFLPENLITLQGRSRVPRA